MQGPQRRGGFFGGTGLTGFSGQGAGGQGGVGAGQFGINTGGFGGGGTGGAGPGFVSGGAGSVGGYVGLLQQLQTVRNAQANVDSQLRTLGLLEANLDAGLIDIVQVDQFRQNIESARANLLSQQVSFQTQLDGYKVSQLAFPPDVRVEVDDSMLRQFEFVDPKTTAVQRLVEDFIDVVGELPQEPGPADVSNAVTVITRLRGQVAEQFESGHADSAALDAKVPERKKWMTKSQQAVFDEELAKLAQSLEDVENRFRQTEPVLESMRDRMPTESRSKLTDEIVALATGLSGLTQELLLVKEAWRPPGAGRCVAPNARHLGVEACARTWAQVRAQAAPRGPSASALRADRARRAPSLASPPMRCWAPHEIHAALRQQHLSRSRGRRPHGEARRGGRLRIRW